jgi:hypothetical protein
MKKIVFLFSVLCCCQLIAQNQLKITPKSCIPRKGIHFKLKEIIEDSRCPEGITCIWAGQVVATIEVYNDKKLIDENTLTFTSKNNEENKKWFAKYLSEDKKLKTIKVLPYPKDKVTVKFKKKYIELVF